MAHDPKSVTVAAPPTRRPTSASPSGKAARYADYDIIPCDGGCGFGLSVNSGRWLICDEHCLVLCPDCAEAHNEMHIEEPI